MAQAIPDRSLVTEISRGFLDCLYSTEVGNSNSGHMNGKDHWGGNGPASLVHTGKYKPPPSPRSCKLISQQLPYDLRLCRNHLSHWSTNWDREITVSKHVVIFWFSVLFIFISTSACATCMCVALVQHFRQKPHSVSTQTTESMCCPLA